MCEKSGDDLLLLLKNLNVNIGNTDSTVIKAWFDTDSEPFLQWICSSITEENYISPQENKEFLTIENPLSDTELDKELNNLEKEFPDLLQYNLNLHEIDILKDTIEVLEEQLEDYENQIKINQQLDHNLSLELSQLSSEEMKLNIEKESAQETCQAIAKKLDEINSKSYDQILRYHHYLCNYELTTNPEFINNMEISKLEEQFIDTVGWVNSTLKNSDLSVEKNISDVLSKLKDRISQGFLNNLSVQMESEALNNVLNDLDKYNFNTQWSFTEGDSLQLNIEYNKSQQHHMLKMLEELSLTQAENYVSQPTIRCYKNEINFCRSNLDYLNEIEKLLGRVLSHLVVVYNLHLREKEDICSSNEFFKNVMQYVQIDLQNSNFRREAMMKVIDEYKNFSDKTFDEKFKLLGNFGTFICKGNQPSLGQILSEIKSIKNEIYTLERKYFINNFEVPKNLINNKKVLESFLTCGPTHRIVTIPGDLQSSFNCVNSNVDAQNSSVKTIMKISQEAKNSFTEDNWINQRRLLWIYFITDPPKLFSLLKILKNEVKLF